ncbi:MAG TPA: acylneuraminate cytidylyltransferase family protein [Syntrophus sp. (in: bacteria)]|jgi:CMP-N,N'-diacetyllegionaminic acid synthase|nr:acylneuraminate cytidylyltransferase family protein [Syntrophus sp. (in: bacteria)]
MTVRPLLCVIPARGGSKGLPGKNIRPLAGLPLIAHSIRCAAMSPVIDRTIISTDSEEIAAVARANGGETPFMRPAELASDTAPMLGVLQHALTEAERVDGRRYEALLLLDPTSPGRLPEDISKAEAMLEADAGADGVVGVSRPEFNPLWHCVVEQDGYMAPLIAGAGKFTRRQELPDVFRINATLYLWRRDYLLGVKSSWMDGRLRLLEVPEARAIHIDDADEFARADLMVLHGLVRFPWLENT